MKPGETLAGISARYRVRDSTIATLDRLGRSPRLEPGQRLILPSDAKLPAPDPSVEHARALVDRCVDDYRDARFEQALQRAREAEALLGEYRDSADPVVRSLRARAAFVAGGSLAAFGESDRAVESFSRVQTLDAHFEPPNGWLSPRLERVYLAARTDWLQRGIVWPPFARQI